MISMLRRKAAWTQFGVERSKFDQDIVYHEGGSEFIPGTKVPRLKPVRLSPRCTTFPSDEIEATIKALRNERDAKPAAKQDASHSETARRGADK